MYIKEKYLAMNIIVLDILFSDYSEIKLILQMLV
jgi:hypothetical protein